MDVRRSLAVAILDRLASLSSSPAARREARLGARPGDAEWGDLYALEQYLHKVRHGSLLGADQPSLLGKDVLEIGCGHGGISCFLAAIGARRVVGIDLSVENAEFGRRLANLFAAHQGRALPVQFLEMDASDLRFDAQSFDVVVAENAFEHFVDPEAVLRECFRVLRPSGVLLVPVFSSIKSKYGLHLKRGLRLPWANLVFSEGVIVEAVRRRAKRDDSLYQTYPGLRDPSVATVRELRRYKDLNDITYGRFLTMSESVGFSVDAFRIHRTLLGRFLTRLSGPSPGGPSFRDEVLSTGAGAVLRKP